MKKIELSKNATKYKGFTAMVDDEDYEYLNRFNWSVLKSPAGNRTVYAYRHVYGPGRHTPSKILRMHRVIMGVDDTSVDVDHIDGNGLNNQKSNLRICNASQNAVNRPSAKNSTSKYLGVAYNRDRAKWKAQIMKNGKSKFLGRFKTEEEAAIAYNKAAKELFGEFAYQNAV